jgi:hypothetical protein
MSVTRPGSPERPPAGSGSSSRSRANTFRFLHPGRRGSIRRQEGGPAGRECPAGDGRNRLYRKLQPPPGGAGSCGARGLPGRRGSRSRCSNAFPGRNVVPAGAPAPAARNRTLRCSCSRRSRTCNNPAPIRPGILPTCRTPGAPPGARAYMPGAAGIFSRKSPSGPGSSFHQPCYGMKGSFTQARVMLYKSFRKGSLRYIYISWESR